MTLRAPQFQVAVSVSVVFLPGSVPADLPRQLPYGDVREERVPVSCKSPAVGLCPVPSPPHSPSPWRLGGAEGRPRVFIPGSAFPR